MQKLLALLSAIILLTACKFNPNVQGAGEPFLQGEWREDSAALKNTLLEYTQHQIKFTCDSFYATLDTYAKVNRYSDECFNNGHWKEYAKGTYAVRNDTLYLIGTYTKENFKQKISGCHHIGQYLPVFLIKKHSPKELQLRYLQTDLPVTLTLVKPITCIPKPL